MGKLGMEQLLSNIKKPLMHVLWSIILGFSSFLATAETLNVEFKLGQSHANWSASSLEKLLTDDINISSDRTDSSFWIELNYPLEADWMLSVGYVDMGNASVTIETDVLSNQTPAYWEEVSTYGPQLTSGFTIGTNMTFYESVCCSINLSTGVLLGDDNNGSSLVTESGEQVSEFDSDSVNLYFGVGFKYMLYDGVSISTQLSRFSLNSNSVNSFTVGVGYVF
jgi:hypothetical protein